MIPQFEIDVVALSLAIFSASVFLLKRLITFIVSRERMLNTMSVNLKKVVEETNTNGGSTLKDGVNRLESAIEMLTNQVLVIEQRLAISFEDILIGSYETDKDGRCTNVDTTYQRITGRGKDESLGQGWINSIHPEDRDKVLHVWEDSVKRRIDFRCEYRFMKPSGKVVTVCGIAKPIIHKDDIKGYVGMVKTKHNE